MHGTRRDISDYSIPSEGEYGKNPVGDWYGRPPDADFIAIANLHAHTVIEHEDGTISVSPSILVSHWSGKLWHGYLEKGIWRKV